MMEEILVGLRASPVKTPPRPVFYKSYELGSLEPYEYTDRRGDVWVSAIVDIEHKSICPFD
jgi:hypothetical protein